MNLITLAWRNFRRNLPRYRVLIVAITIIVALLTIVTGALVGLTGTVRDKASRYFTGHVTIQSFEDTGASSRIRDVEAVKDMVRTLPFRFETYAPRSNYYQTDSELFFAGNAIGQRRLVGVDWTLEREVLGDFLFLSGGLPDSDVRDAVLISQATADRLGASVGDQIIVSLTTRRGQRNTGTLTVSGIYQEASFFGYTSYLDRRTLNQLYGFAESEVTEIGIYVGNPARERRIARAVQQALSQRFQTFPLLESRAERDAALDGRWDGQTYAVLTLNAQLAEIQDLVRALTLVSVVIVAFFLTVVVIGVTNTYSLVVREREVEIGTLRSLGLTRSRTTFLFLWESMFMGLASSVVGMAVGLSTLVAGRAFFLFRGAGVASLFLEQGRLAWNLNVSSALAIVAVALLSSLTGALRPALYAGRIRPAEALRNA